MRPPPSLSRSSPPASTRVAIVVTALVLLGIASRMFTVPPARAASPPPPALVQADDSPVGPLASPIGQVGGVTSVIVPDGDRLWIGIGPRVAVVDVADVTRPRVVGRSAWLDGVVFDLAVENGIGVASTGTQMLHTLDTSEPSAPTVTGKVSVGNAVRQVVLAGGFAYAIHEVATSESPGLFSWRDIKASNIAVIDIRRPHAPVVVNRSLLPTDVYATDLLVAGGALVIATTRDPNADLETPQRELRIYALDDPSAPQLVATHSDPAWMHLATGQAPERADVVYGYGSGGGLAAISVGDPARPAIVARYTLKAERLGDFGEDWQTLRLSKLTVLGDGRPVVVQPYRYVDDVILIPRSGPAPAQLWSDYIVSSLQGSSAGGFATRGQTVFAAEVGGRVRAIDLPHLQNEAHEMGALSNPGTVADVATGRGPDVGTLFATAHLGGLSTLDLGDPANPLPLANANRDQYPNGLVVEGGIATVFYVGDGHRSDTRYEIVDVRDPTAPAFRSSVGYDSRILLGAMVRTGQFLIVQESDESWRPTLNTYDLSEPSRPLRVASLPMAGIITDMAVDGSRLALIHKPQAPVPPEAEPRVEIYNIADAAKPVRVADIDFQAVGIGEFAIPPSQIEFANNTVFISALAWNRLEKPFQLHAFDVADPTAPRYLATLALPMSPTDLVVQDGYLFAITQCSSPAAAGCSIVIVDVRDPANPRIAGRLPGASGAAEANPEVRKSPNSVAVDRGLVYIASGAAGIYVYRPRLDWPPEADVPTWPTIFMPYGAK